MAGDEGRPGSERPANDNRASDEKNASDDVAERLDAVVLSIARLIGRRMAREDHANAMRAANDNDPDGKADARKDDQCADDD